MVTIDVAAILQAVLVWLAAAAIVTMLAAQGGRSRGWGTAVFVTVMLLAVMGAASLLWMLL